MQPNPLASLSSVWGQLVRLFGSEGSDDCVDLGLPVAYLILGNGNDQDVGGVICAQRGDDDVGIEEALAGKIGVCHALN